jgi:hypothetical protein
MPTLRQMQRLFSAAARKNTALAGEGLDALDAFLSGRDWQPGDAVRFSCAAAWPDGTIAERCPCRDCRNRGVVEGARRWVDRLVRTFGPNADLEDLLRQRQKSNQRQQQQRRREPGSGQPSQGQSSQDQPSQDQPSQDQPSQGQPDSAETDAAEDAAREAAEQAAAAKKAADDAAAKAAAEETAEKRRRLRDQAAAAKAEAKTVKSSRSRRRAKSKLRHARRALSHDAKKEATGVSLRARKQVSRGLARLNNVPTPLKTQMANLISRLVAQGGTAGERLGPVPVLSATKLVKRLVVRRPLPNALKEDIVTGRPVILFLPDISPSCAKQAQPACDLANAAGYAGVRGSDVLVLPHFNGMVDSDEEYIPWFNGRPAAKTSADARSLFAEVCGGRSKFVIRVAVFVGDHDAVEQYLSTASIPSITRVLWLHNDATKSGRPEPAPSSIVPQWPADVLRKLSMVSGCCDLKTMLQGFDAALKMRK